MVLINNSLLLGEEQEYGETLSVEQAGMNGWSLKREQEH